MMKRLERRNVVREGGAHRARNCSLIIQLLSNCFKFYIYAYNIFLSILLTKNKIGNIQSALLGTSICKK